MNIFQELRQRRVPQISSGYIVAGWGIIQFLEFLESRMAVSPNLVNLVGIGLLLLMPSIVILAWVHGRPGRDTWGRIPSVLVPANILAIVLLLFFLFRGEDLGAITKTIEVQDENGAISERVVPKNQFRRRVLIFYPENIGNQSNQWARETSIFLLALDLNQDIFLEPVTPIIIVGALQDAGSEDGHGLTRPLQRKLARESHLPYFLTSTINHEQNQWTFTSELHESESGRVLAMRTIEAPDLFTLADLTSLQLREDLGIPSSHLQSSLDLPVAELSSTDIEAVKSHVKGMVAITHHNDWEQGGPLFDDAVQRDPGFALAQFLRFAVYQTLGQSEKSNEAISMAMDNLYRVSERTSFLIKTQYYYNVKQDADKAMAVLDMWSQIYPNDIEAYNMQATYYYIRQDLPNTIKAYENILAIDPGQVTLIRRIASLHQQSGNNQKAEEYFLQFIEMFPTDPKGYRDLAELYSATAQLDRAREALEKAQLVDPGDLDITLGLIGVDIKLGKFNSSVQALNSEFAKSKTGRDNAKILSRQVPLAEILGQTDQLIKHLDILHSTMLEIQNPLQANLIFSVLVPKISSAGQPQIALTKLDSLAAYIPPPYDELIGVGRAWVLADLGRTEEARAALIKATELVESFKIETFRPLLSLIEGMIVEEEGNPEEAVDFFKLALETTLQVETFYQVRLARSLRKSDQSNEALEVLNTALMLNPAHPKIHLEMALVFVDLEKVDLAKEHLNTALEVWDQANPVFPPAKEAHALGRTINPG